MHLSYEIFVAGEQNSELRRMQEQEPMIPEENQGIVVEKAKTERGALSSGMPVTIIPDEMPFKFTIWSSFSHDFLVIDVF